MTEERTVYETDQSAEKAYLEEAMRQMNLHKGLREWVRAAYRLKGVKYAMQIVRAWQA